MTERIDTATDTPFKNQGTILIGVVAFKALIEFGVSGAAAGLQAEKLARAAYMAVEGVDDPNPDGHATHEAVMNAIRSHLATLDLKPANRDAIGDLMTTRMTVALYGFAQAAEAQAAEAQAVDRDATKH